MKENRIKDLLKKNSEWEPLENNNRIRNNNNKKK